MECGSTFEIWVDWERRVVSFHDAPGLERLCFFTASAMQARLQMLLTEGFLFQ